MSYRKKTVYEINQPLLVEEFGLKDNSSIKALDISTDYVNCSTRNFEKEKFILEKQSFLDGEYLFFSPFIYKNGQTISFFSDMLSNRYDLDENMIIKTIFNKSEFNSLEFTFKVNWDEFKNYALKTSFKIKTKNFNLFKKKFDNFIPQYILMKEYENLSYEYHVNNDDSHLMRSANFDLNFIIMFDYIIHREEKIVIKFSKLNKEQNDDNVLKKIFQKKLPSKNYIDIWNSEKQYYAKDIVEYENAYYQAIEDNEDQDFKSNKWKKIEFNEFSFANRSSFFHSEHGKKSIEILKKNLSLLIEHKIGDRICINYISKDVSKIPNLNDYFIYGNIKYRIIKIEINESYLKNSIIIYGLEMLNIDRSKLDDILFENKDIVLDPIILDKTENDIFDIRLNIPKSIVKNEYKGIDL